ncbi:MAG: CDP-alcohol phosphatidyltransferase family protein [Methanocorpusculaceae archaeon]|nr:CDP-alcohol phosphatidyltransferase family protein [Methanocorpusculaceae archaeon]
MNITSIRHKLTGWLDPFILLLSKTGITPNQIMFLSFLFGMAAAACYLTTHFIIGSILLAVSGILDLTDGSVARLTDRKSDFGAIIDWIVDKYVDGIVLLAVGLSCFVSVPAYLAGFNIPQIAYIGVAGLAVIGSIMNTFIKPVTYAETGYTAKDDGKISDPLEGVGFFGRPETMLFLIAGGLFGFIWISITVIAVCTNLSAIQRICYLWKRHGGYKNE